MGYDVYSSGTITLPDDAVDAVWSAFCDSADQREIADAEACAGADGTAGKVCARLSGALGGDHEGNREVVFRDDSVDLVVSAYGRTYDAEETLKLVAAHGGTGEIEALGEDSERWRWRLAEGTLHTDSARTLYDGDVDEWAWIAQLQAPDDSDLDHVAVVPSEAAARAQIAAWCREDYRTNAAEMPASFPEITDDLDDDAAIEAWTCAASGVRYRVVRVGAAEM